MTCDILPETTTLTVLSLNCWGIRWVSKDYKYRMKAICEALFQDRKQDVICLQEIWNISDFEWFQLEATNCKTFPYSHYFYSGVMGSGVCIFSKWPIEEVLFHKWQVNGYVHKVFHADWYGGKGIGLCRLNVRGRRVNIYTCHTHAEYSDDAEYLAHRLVQAFDIAQFIRVTSQNVDLAVLAADLNTEPDELCFKIITDYADLNDSFKLDRVKFLGTYGSSGNSYSDPKTVKKNPQGQRIDYILYKAGPNANVECWDYCNPLQQTIPLCSYSYSDHDAISAMFKISDKFFLDDNHGHFEQPSKSYKESLEEAYLVCDKAAEELSNHMKWCFRICIMCIVIFIVSLISFCFVNDRILPLVSLGCSFFICLCSLFTLVWKQMERRGILCAAHGMKLSIRGENDNCEKKVD
ncbi:putative neutral sphingomyelinase isoform X2 [Planococcus citri]|uniref:putative neutral sphingomyelinase isoform X2 n=1 Tax=Planococcus citri TaxID=170843 RepID=UPI0031F88E28